VVRCRKYQKQQSTSQANFASKKTKITDSKSTYDVGFLTGFKTDWQMIAKNVYIKVSLPSFLPTLTEL
jgi:hypothetical protein